MRLVAGARLRAWSWMVLLLAAGGETWAQPVTTTARAGWRVGGPVNAVARLGDVIYIGGGFRGVAPEANVAAGVLSADASTGALLEAPLLNGNVNVIEPDGAGGFYLGGNFLDAKVNGAMQLQVRLAHVLANGSLDPAFHPSTDGGPVRALEFVPGVGLFVGGEFTGISGTPRTRVALLDGTTGAVQAWNYAVAGANASVRALAYDNGALLIGGTFATVDATASANLAVVSTTANGLVGADPGVDQIVEGLQALGDGRIYVGGGFAAILGSARARVARITHTAGTQAITLDSWNPGPGTNGNVRAFGLGNGTVYVGGDFSSVGGTTRGRLAELDAITATLTGWAPEVSGTIAALAVDATQVFVGGPFNEISGDTRNGAAAIDRASAAAVGWNPSPAGAVNAIAVAGSTVMMGGGIAGFGAEARNGLAALDLQSGAILPWNPGMDGTQIDEILIRGNAVYISGNFTTVGGDVHIGAVAVDPIFGATLNWNPDLNGAVTAMVFDATSAYISGAFTTVNGLAHARLARVSLATGDVDATFNPTVTGGSAMDLILSGATLYLGGNFTTVNGVGATRVAAVDAATGALTPGFTASADNTVQRLDLAGGFLYLAGSFSVVDGSPRTAIARVSAASGLLDAWAPALALPAGAQYGFTVSVNDVLAVNGVVILSGAFETVGGQQRFGLATVDAGTGAPTAWAPQLGTPPLGGFGGVVLPGDDVTVVAGARIQLNDDLLNGLALFVESGAPRVLPPTNLTATISGSSVTFSWSTSPLGPASASYVLEAGTAQGLANIGSLPMGSGTTFTVPGVPPGTYWVRVRTVHASGTSAPTPDIAVTVGGVGCSSPPLPPGELDYDVNGSTVTFRWAIGPGPMPTSFLLQAGASPGVMNIGTFPAGSDTQITFGGIPTGVYYVRLLAQNACGISAPGVELPLLVNVQVAPPLAPLGLVGTANAGTVQLSWVEPPFLPVTGYVLEVGSAPGLSNLVPALPVAGTTFASAGVPPGVYYVRVRGVNASGVGAASSEIRLVVN